MDELAGFCVPNLDSKPRVATFSRFSRTKYAISPVISLDAQNWLYVNSAHYFKPAAHGSVIL
jgi:hypothetical protein